ncbi:GbsR/MarR family transcriptional regulator [Catalinimonas niigatensis]|uniref:GbsR/MarR family transcriptional regulator n=1 Tax=Catalinimonas niigatensis TaxID=1397264 RepID=UPI002665199E|nr:helix-turn-helix domain-containing protein [Catalinimonas niigatensis]WPP52826.1 helix-turn-helix domain-containing protein [Catalinimonas niigatensis]
MEQHRDHIEHYGRVMEGMGLTPVAARVYIYLLLSPQEGATFEDLVSYLKVSKSAVSNALKMLTSTSMAEYKTIGGQRKRYFFVNFESMFSEKNVTAKFKLISDMLEDVKSIRNIDDAFAKELDRTILLYKMMLVEFPIIFERWKKTIAWDERS